MALLLLFVAALSLTTQVNGREKTVGYELIRRDTLITTGPMIFIYRESVLSDGLVTAFHCYFGERGSLRFQVWRPAQLDLSSSMFSLVGEKVVTDVDQGNYTIRLSETEKFRVKDGDRLAFLNEAMETCITASFLPVVKNSIFFHSITGPPPSVGDQVKFDKLSYPYQFSIAVSYDKDTERKTTESSKYGPVGATGSPGETGATGATGPWGRSGAPGGIGPGGRVGPPGSIGESGPPGFTGERGEQGRSGVTGSTGPRGYPGATGRPGTPGGTGSTGSPAKTGATGVPGERGATGGAGQPGTEGYMGETGATGPFGRTGATGATGPPGPRGVIGALGVKGPLGRKGDRGPQGGAGPRGSPGPLYTDVNECVTLSHGCEQGCVNVFGTYQCTCSKGYKLRSDGRTCQDVNECRVQNGGCELSCTNTLGSYRCGCSLGLQLSTNGHTCLDIRECTLNRGHCGEDETCVDTWGGHVCLFEGAMLASLRKATRPVAHGNAAVVAQDTLLNANLIIGLIAWLTALTLIIIILIICACARKVREDRLRKKYLRYQELGEPIRRGSDKLY